MSIVRRQMLLIETMRLRALLLESRIDFLRTNMLPRLQASLGDHIDGIAIPRSVAGAMEMQAGETPAERLFNYVLSVDPDPVKSNAQWLFTLILRKRDPMPLEDLEIATEVLTEFMRKKKHRELAADQTDINRFRSLSALSAAIKDHNQAVMTASEAEEHAAFAQSDTLYNGPDYLIVVPKTKEAAWHFGRGTEWCTTWSDPRGSHPTRQSHYESYERRGPLYIILQRATGKRWQFQSDSQQYMDQLDQQISLPSFFQTHPKVAQVLGQTPDFVAGVLLHSPSLIGMFPGDVRTPQVAERLRQLTNGITAPNGRLDVFQGFDYSEWPDNALINGLWNGSLTLDDYERLRNTRLRPDVIADMMMRTGKIRFSDDRKSDPEVIAALHKLTDDLPPNSDKLAVYYGLDYKFWPINAFEYAITKGKISYVEFSTLAARGMGPSPKTYMLLTAKHAPYNLKGVKPEEVEEAGGAADIIKTNPKTMEYLPAASVSDEDLVQYAQENLGQWSDFSKLAYLDPARINDTVLAAINSQRNQYDKFATPDDLERDLRRRWFQSFPNPARNTASRRFNTPVEAIDAWYATLPERYRNEEFYNAMFDQMFDSAQKQHGGEQLQYLMSGAPEKLITPHMMDRLGALHRRDGLDKRILQSAITRYVAQWTPAFIEAMLSRDLIKPKDVPERYQTPRIAAAQFAADPHNKDYAFAADDESLIKQIDRVSYTIGAAIPAERLTEPVLYAILKHRSREKAGIPKAALSKRVFEAGVPWTFELKDVPKKWRDEVIEIKAIQKRPQQIKYIADKLGFLNKHFKSFADEGAHWEDQLEANGYVRLAKSIAAIADLPAHDLDGGYTLHYGEAAKKTQRMFLLKAGKTIAKLTVKNNKLSMANEHPGQDLEPVLREIATKILPASVDIAVLNRVGIYRDRDGKVKDRAATSTVEFEKDGIKWTKTPHLKGALYSAWLGETLLLTLYVAASGGWGGTWPKFQEMKIKDRDLCFDHNAAILNGLKSIRADQPENARWELADIGIDWKKGPGYYLDTEKKVGTVGQFTVYYTPAWRQITIFGKQGRAATANVLKSGALSKEQVHGWRYEAEAGDIGKILKAMGEKLKVSGVTVAPKTPKR